MALKIVSKIYRNELLSATSIILIGYGLLICATNRTRYSLFINSVSLTRIGLGAVFAFAGWLILLILYGFNAENPTKPRKSRKK